MNRQKDEQVLDLKQNLDAVRSSNGRINEVSAEKGIALEKASAENARLQENIESLTSAANDAEREKSKPY